MNDASATSIHICTSFLKVTIYLKTLYSKTTLASESFVLHTLLLCMRKKTLIHDIIPATDAMSVLERGGFPEFCMRHPYTANDLL